MIEKDTSLVFLAHPMLELCSFVFFKMANGGHFEFCGFSIFSYFFSKYILVVKSINIQRYRENGHGFGKNDYYSDLSSMF